MSTKQQLRNLGIPENLPPEELKRLLEEKLEKLKREMAEEEARYIRENPSDL